MKKIVSFRKISILLVVVLLIASVGSFAAGILVSENVTINKGIRLIIDGEELEPKDVNGNKIPIFVLNGTTYLPVRAVSNVFGKKIEWDGNEKIVYLGEKPGEKTFMGWESYYKAGNYADERLVWEKEHLDQNGKLMKNVVYPGLMSEEYRYENPAPYGDSIVTEDQGGDEEVILDGKYTRFTATFFVPKEATEHEYYTEEKIREFYSKDISVETASAPARLFIEVTYLSGASENKKLFERELYYGMDNIDVDLDITNVKSMNIWMNSGQSHDGEAVQGMMASPTFHQ